MTLTCLTDEQVEALPPSERLRRAIEDCYDRNDYHADSNELTDRLIAAVRAEERERVARELDAAPALGPADFVRGLK